MKFKKKPCSCSKVRLLKVYPDAIKNTFEWKTFKSVKSWIIKSANIVVAVLINILQKLPAGYKNMESFQCIVKTVISFNPVYRIREIREETDSVCHVVILLDFYVFI